MVSQVPDPKSWRPSESEWYPRLHIGQHWQDKSIPVYCYFVKRPSYLPELSQWDIKWAIRPLGDPLKGKPSWTSFIDPVSCMIGENTCLNFDLKRMLIRSMQKGLTDKYLAQKKFNNEAPVYREEELAKRAMPRRPSIPHLPIQSLREETGPSTASKRKNEDGQEQSSESATKKTKVLIAVVHGAGRWLVVMILAYGRRKTYPEGGTILEKDFNFQG